MLKLCIDNAALVVKFNRQILVKRGHGDGLTKWNGWSWKLLLIKLVTYNSKKKQLVRFIVILIKIYQTSKWKGWIKNDNLVVYNIVNNLVIISP